MTMSGELPSVIVARYRNGELTREQAADALSTAAWDSSYKIASMQPGGDYDGDPFSPESFATVVYVPSMSGQLDDEDYAAFQAAAVRAARRG